MDRPEMTGELLRGPAPDRPDQVLEADLTKWAALLRRMRDAAR